MVHRWPRPSRSLVVSALWAVAWLVAIDVAVNVAFRPSQAAGQMPSNLTRYFEYGRSIEGKLSRMVADPKGVGQIISAGWLDAESLQRRPVQQVQGSDLRVTVYGQSFAMDVTQAAAKLDGRITVRAVGGPAAPPNHSYAAYLADAPVVRADVVVVGLLSASVVHMRSMTGMIWMFEGPAPFSFPRYRLDGDALAAESPLIGSEAAFLEAFRLKTELWRLFKEQLAHNDVGFGRFVFDESWLDHSAIVRLVRRAWVAHSSAYSDGVFDPAEGFRPDAAEAAVLQRMLVDLRDRTNARGERLIVLLLHTRGHGEHLNNLLAPTLTAGRIDFLSTHSVFSANDPANFIADGHYTEQANQKLSKLLLEMIRKPSDEARTVPAKSER